MDEGALAERVRTAWASGRGGRPARIESAGAGERVFLVTPRGDFDDSPITRKRLEDHGLEVLSVRSPRGGDTQVRVRISDDLWEKLRADEELDRAIDRRRGLLERGPAERPRAPAAVERRPAGFADGVRALAEGLGLVAPRTVAELQRRGDVEGLLRRLRAAGHASSPAWWDAAEALTALGAREAIQPLHAELSWPQHHETTWSLAALLMRLGDTRCVGHVIGTIPDVVRDRGDARTRTLRFLQRNMERARLVASLREYLTGHGDLAAGFAVDALLEMGEHGGLAECVPEWVRRDEFSHSIDACARALGKEAVTPGLITALARTASRERAVRYLGRHGTPAATEPLLSLLEGAEGDLASTIAHALGRIGDARAVPTLVRLLARAESRVALAVLQALASLRDPAAFDGVAACLHKSRELRVAAAETLAELDHPDVVPTLEAHARRARERARRVADKPRKERKVWIDGDYYDHVEEAHPEERERSAVEEALRRARRKRVSGTDSGIGS